MAEAHYAVEGAPRPTCSCGKSWDEERYLVSHIEGKARAATGAPAGAVGTEKRSGQPSWAKSLEADLTALLVEAGSYLTVPLPFTGFFFVARAPVRARALVTLAERDEKIRKALEKMVRVSVLATIAGALVDTGITVGIDVERIEPDSMPAQLRGITEEYARFDEMMGAEEARDAAFQAERDGQGGGGLLAELAGQAS